MSPEDLRMAAKRVVWFKKPEDALQDTSLFLAHVMTYGTLSDITTTPHYTPLSLEMARPEWERSRFGLVEPARMPLFTVPTRRTPSRIYTHPYCLLGGKALASRLRPNQFT